MSLNLERRDRLREEYFEWLVHLAQLRGPESNRVRLARILHTIDFVYTIPNDDNREMDGYSLRDRFIDDVGYGDHELNAYLDLPVSVFEVLLAIAIRMEDILYIHELGDRTAVWFEELLDNLDLLDKTDEAWLDNGWNDSEVRTRCDVFIHRRYTRRGTNGGLFPLESTRKDQRNVELWYQMNTYLREKYLIDD